MLTRTRRNRESLIEAFREWLRERGKDWDQLLSGPSSDLEAINEALVQYGRWLYESGKPYWRFSETVNATAAARPTIRRQLQAAWDLAFAWQSLEPYTHHLPLPAVVLLAMLSVCLLWGWKAEAGLFAMSWGGLLRIGEASGAQRKQLVLPSDVLYIQSFVLLQILEPKTRLRGARHQSSKIEPSDLVATIVLAFEDYTPTQPLWPSSNQTLRRRFDAVLKRLGILQPRSTGNSLTSGLSGPAGPHICS